MMNVATAMIKVVILLISKCFNRIPDVLVSSANIKSASFKIRIALRVMSSIFPTGVGTIYRIPIKSTNIYNYLIYSKKAAISLQFLKRLCIFAPNMGLRKEYSYYKQKIC